MAWSRKECHRNGIDETPENQRSVLGNVLSHIRFPTMSLREFAHDVSRSGILSAEDRCAIFEYLACRGECEVDDADLKSCHNTPTADGPISFRFPVTHRLRPLPLVLHRFNSFGKSSIYSGDCSMMRLRCDRPVVIRGFGVSGSMGCDPLAELLVTVKQDRQFLCNRSVIVSDDMTGTVHAGWILVFCIDNSIFTVYVFSRALNSTHSSYDNKQNRCSHVQFT